MNTTEKKDRPQLGLAIPVSSKVKSSSYDLKGNFIIDGKSYRFGAYKSVSKGNGKLPEGQEYFYFHRIELMDGQPSAAPTNDTSFDPSELEA